jgi:hypothetical protein
VQEVASVADVETGFPREVAETFLRCKRDGFDQTNAIIELNALKIAEDRTFADCARYIFTTILGELQACLSLMPSQAVPPQPRVHLLVSELVNQPQVGLAR